MINIFNLINFKNKEILLFDKGRFMIQDVLEPAVANFVQKSFEIISVIDFLLFRTRRMGTLFNGYPQEKSSLSRIQNCLSL